MFRLTQCLRKLQDGNDAGDQVAEATPGLGASKYTVDLAAEEQLWGGHTVKDHVGKSPAELIAEQEANRVDIPVEGGVDLHLSAYLEAVYPSLESANDFVNRLLQGHTDEVDKVASGEWPNQWVEKRFELSNWHGSYPNRERTKTRPTYNAGVFIVHDERIPRGYRVQTAYPTNDKNSYPLRESPF